MSTISRLPVCVGMSLALVLSSFAAHTYAAFGASSPASKVVSVDPRILALAKQWFHRFQTGNIDRSQLDEKINKELTPAMIRQEARTLKAYGTPISFEFLRLEPTDDAKGYYFILGFKSGKVVEAIALHPDGKIAGIDFMQFVRTR